MRGFPPSCETYQHADDAARRPTSHAIGVDADGNFRTSCHQEYPGRLSAGLANAIGSQLIRTLRDRLVRAIAEPPLPLAQFITDVNRESTAIIRDAATWFPDFQG